MKIKSKNRIPLKTAIIAGVVLISLAIPQIAMAIVLEAGQAYYLVKGAIEIFSKMTPANVALAIVSIISETIFDFLSWVVRAAADFFNAILNIGFTSHIDIVKAGWGVTRDFSNMLFILFLVIIAFATILRLPQYGIKNLLPKVILIALLINFSYVICGVIIDFSNITANFFISNIQQYAGKGGISGEFADSLNLMGLHAGLNCNNVNQFPTPEERDECLKAVSEGLGNNLINFALSMTIGSLIMLLAAFTLFAGAILLLIRIVVIWFLVMIVPLVFICYIMPGLRKNWQTWWSTFLRWCFFAPAYAFFIWLAMKVSIEGGTKKIASMSPQGFADVGFITNQYAINPGNALIHYFFIIALLLGGLIAASKMGIYGANTALSIVQKTKQGAVNWAKRTGMRPVRGLGERLGAGAATFGGEKTRIGRRMLARATQLRRAPAERPEHKKYAALLGTMSNSDVLKEMKKAFGVRKLIATQEVTKRGLLRDADAKDVRVAMENLGKFRDFESLEKLKELRADAIVDTREQDRVIQKVTQEGNLNKIPAIAFKDEKLVAAIGRFASAVQMESLRNASPQHTENLKDALDTLTTAKNATLAAMSALDQEKIHHSYASQTGDIDRMTNAQLEKWAKTAGPDGIKRISSTSSLAAIHVVAENMPTNQLANIVEKIQDNAAAKEIVHYLDTSTSPSAAANQKAVRENPYLKSLIP